MTREGTDDRAVTTRPYVPLLCSLDISVYLARAQANFPQNCREGNYLVGGHFSFLSFITEVRIPRVVCRPSPTLPPPHAAAITKTFVLRSDLIALIF